MRILGLDTATSRASVGLLVDGEVVDEQSQVARGSHAVTVLPLIADTLHRAGCRVRDLDAIAVSSGPGSFTGLRVGLSVAKGLACATAVPVVAVPTLEALARTLPQDQGCIWTILDARKGEVYAASFESVSAGGVRRLTPDTVVSAAELVTQMTVPCVVVGDALPRYGAFLQAQLGAGATLLPYDTYGASGGVVAIMGCERLRAGAADLAASIEPVYVRPSDAERNRGGEGLWVEVGDQSPSILNAFTPPGPQAPKPLL